MNKKFRSGLGCFLLSASILFSVPVYAANLPTYDHPTSTAESLYADNTPTGQFIDAVSTREAKWHQDSNGWWYELDNGDYARQTWLQIDGYWYYFNSDGYMLVGWQYINSNWYYLNTGSISGSPQGAMVTGTISLSGNNFSFKSSGELYATQLGVTRILEEQSQWCWVGSVKSIGDFVNPGNGITQSEICIAGLGSIINAGATPSQVAIALEYITDQPTSYSVPLSMNDSANLIMNYKPFVLGFNYVEDGETKGHAVTCIGYDEAANTLTFIDADEAISSPQTVNLNTLKSGYNYPGISIPMQYKSAIYLD